jgi:hypothetical protein
MVPTLPDSDSQSRQLFGLLVEECGDPRYESVSKTKGRTICRILLHPYSIIQGAQHAAPLPTTVSMTRPGKTQIVKSGSLGAIVRSFKSAVARRAGIELHSHRIWQRNFYEHIIRDEIDYERIAAYILTNPAN